MEGEYRFLAYRQNRDLAGWPRYVAGRRRVAAWTLAMAPLALNFKLIHYPGAGIPRLAEAMGQCFDFGAERRVRTELGVCEFLILGSRRPLPGAAPASSFGKAQ